VLILLKQIGSDVSELLDRFAPEGGGRPNGRHAGNSGVRP
jgi:hypothetical protein